MAMRSFSQSKSDTFNQALAFEKAREAVIVLKTVNPMLSPAEKETLEILMNRELMKDLEKSLTDSKAGRISKLESIL